MMEAKKLKVLLVGENPQGSSYLVNRLEGQGCECRFAASYQEACSVLRKEAFDLVLSAIRLRSGSVFPLIDVLEGAGATLFYSHSVEDSCWWLPALQRGKRCFGSPALRPSEFIGLLDRVVGEIRSGAGAAPAKPAAPDVQASAPAVPPAAGNADLPMAPPVRTKDRSRVKRKAAG